MLTLAFLPKKAANIVIMGVCCCTALGLSRMQDQTLLMLRWRSFLRGGSHIITGLCAHKGGQYCDYGLTLSHSPVIIEHARPEIRDTPLTLIAKMGQRTCRLPLYIDSRPITPLFIDVTKQPFDCRQDQTEIFDAPLMLIWKTYQQPFVAQWFWIIFILSSLTANITFLCIIICIQKHRGLSVSEPPLFTSSARYIT